MTRETGGRDGIGIENYQGADRSRKAAMIVADYRRETKAAPVEPINQEEDM